ncbi:hypothetical protein COU56_01395 [Candidatus Pacearchaeota archaeon CG10_big_fil_rev_8_21_14_0_10_31_9]|nr:MAG: hypothetical protein COU56_01395 [Candidatus Pacearchaeota archaeon CG10_big_fil_rev_8_21_14_0_10_31_9]
MNKKSQVTIFVILAILIVAAIVLLFVIYKKDNLSIKPTGSDNPQELLESCIQSNLEEAIDKVITNSGYIQLPQKTKSYKGKDIPYLCYTANTNEKCYPSEDVWVEHLEDEIHSYMNDKVSNCVNQMKSDYEAKAYKVSVNYDGFSISLVPDKAKVRIDADITTEKSDEQRTFSSVEITTFSPLYEMAIIIHKIIYQEARYCNSDYPLIMRTNDWVEITKDQTGDDEKVYTVIDTKTVKTMQFALRNCVQPTPK